MSRSGDEPSHARSPLRLRLVLALAGTLVWAGGAIAFWVAGEPVLTLIFAAVAVLSLVNAGVVVHRMRQGPHWQPGPTTPPYHPVAPERPQRPRGPTGPVPEQVRVRRYLSIMGACLVLIVLAWGVVRLWSVTAAVIMSLVAMLLPPIAAIVANQGWDRDGR